MGMLDWLLLLGIAALAGAALCRVRKRRRKGGGCCGCSGCSGCCADCGASCEHRKA